MFLKLFDLGEDDLQDEEVPYDDADDNDDEEEVDEEAVFARIEHAFREERARIRDCDDIDDLRGFRDAYLALEPTGRLSQAGRVRAHDLIELVDDRITDLKAQQLAERRR